LAEKSDDEVHELLNQVKVEVTLHFIAEWKFWPTHVMQWHAYL
jgi:hypothetical protein